jgi:hypothetical protein
MVNPYLSSCAQLVKDYMPGAQLPRQGSDVMVEAWVREALVRLNPKLLPNLTVPTKLSTTYAPASFGGTG